MPERVGLPLSVRSPPARAQAYSSGRLALPRVAGRRPLAWRRGCGGGDGGSSCCRLRRRCRGGRRLAAVARLLRPRGGALPDELAAVVPPRAQVKVPAHIGLQPQSHKGAASQHWVCSLVT